MNEFDKYLNLYNFCKSLKLKEKEKLTLFSSHIASLTLQALPQPDEFDQDEGGLSESESDDSDINSSFLDN